MTTHTLKSWPAFFQAIRAGKKTHDLRDERDRRYEVGDVLVLQEYDPFLAAYTGLECSVEVTYITSSRSPCAFSSAVLPKEYAILSIRVIG